MSRTDATLDRGRRLFPLRPRAREEWRTYRRVAGVSGLFAAAGGMAVRVWPLSKGGWFFLFAGLSVLLLATALQVARRTRAAPAVDRILGRARRLLRPPRGLKVTREGKYYVAFCLGLGLAALNTGNNLLFLILGLQLSVIVVSGILSEAVIAELTVERELPPHATAGQPALVGLRVRNLSRRVTSLSITIADHLAAPPGTAPAEAPPAGKVSLVRLGPGEIGEGAYRFVPARRGRVHFEEAWVMTCFPFGLFEKWRTVRLPASLLVFPSPLAAEVGRRRPAAREGGQPSQRAGAGMEFFALRDYRPGDDARAIHWRTSARTGELVVVERQHEHRRRVALLLDNRVAPGPDGERALDRACSVAAYLARRALDEGAELALASAGGAHVSPAFGAAQLRRVLTALALLAPAPPEAAPPRVPLAWGADALDVLRPVVAREEGARA